MTTLLLAAQAVGGGTGILILMVAVLVIMRLSMIRPQQEKQEEIRNFQNALQEGSRITINGGIYDTVKRIDLTTNKVDVEVARGVTVQVDRNFPYVGAILQNTTNT